jgi:hypothetical protein
MGELDRLRKEACDALVAASRASSAAEVRDIISAINDRICEANRNAIEGPSLTLMPYEPERVVRAWRAQHSDWGPPGRCSAAGPLCLRPGMAGAAFEPGAAWPVLRGGLTSLRPPGDVPRNTL